LELFKTKKVLEKVSDNAKFAYEELKKTQGLPHVGDVRQVGLMIGIELVENKETKKAYPLEEKRGGRVISEARKKGAILRPLGNVVVLMPPLSMERSLLGELLNITYDCIKTVTE